MRTLVLTTFVLMLPALASAQGTSQGHIVSLVAGEDCLYSETSNTLEYKIHINVDENNPQGLGMFAWSMFIRFDPGLIPVRIGDNVVCPQSHADDCCNYCNGFHTRAYYRPDIGEGVYQFGYAGTPCTNPCGSATCSGTHTDIDLILYVGIDLTYNWTEGTHYRDATIINTNNPADNNLWSCCAGQTQIPCDGCGGQCNRMGFSIQNGTHAQCVVIGGPGKAGGEAAPATSDATWGQVKNAWRNPDQFKTFEEAVQYRKEHPEEFPCLKGTVEDALEEELTP